MRVLIAIDGSEAAEQVLSEVAPWLSSVHADVDLLTVIDRSEIHGTLTRRPDQETTQWVGELGTDPESGVRFPSAPAPAVWEFSSQALEEMRTERVGNLEQLAGRYLSAVDFQVHVVTSNHAAEAILRSAAEMHADAIAIGTHGRTGLRRLLFGSVAEEVVRHAHVPVMVIPTSPARRAAAPIDASPAA